MLQLSVKQGIDFDFTDTLTEYYPVRDLPLAVSGGEQLLTQMGVNWQFFAKVKVTGLKRRNDAIKNNGGLIKKT